MFCAGDILRQQGGLAFELGLGLDQVRLSGLHGGLRLLQRGLVGSGLDHEQRVALFGGGAVDVVDRRQVALYAGFEIDLIEGDRVAGGLQVGHTDCCNGCATPTGCGGGGT